jgi:hypothetical protein
LAPTQATGSLQPIKAATSFNGAYGGVTFDGVDDFLLVSSIGTMPSGTASGEIYVAAHNTALAADATDRTALGYGVTTVNAARRIGRVSNGTINKAKVTDQSTTLTDDGVANPFNGAAIVNGKWDSATESGFMQGVAFSPTASQADAFVTGTNRTVIGGTPAAAPTLLWQGPIRQLLVINGVLSTQDRQRMEGWLAWDCGLTGSLPAGHPYKSVRP